MKITPAIIPEDYLDLQSKLSRLKGISKAVQIDVCDGKFSPKASWPYANDPEGHFEMILEQEEGMPFWDEFDFEIDMMVRYPDVEYERWINAGGSRIVIHHYLGQQDRTKKVFLNVEARGCEPIICFEADTALEEIYSFIDPQNDFLKNIQLMGIRHDGFQGEPFDPKTLERVRTLRQKFLESEIVIDGGVNEETAAQLAEAGADRLVIGHALFNMGDLKEAFEYFQSL